MGGVTAVREREGGVRRATTHIKLDANHRAVVADLKKMGVKVQEILEPVDLFCAVGSTCWAFVELKIAGSRATFTRKQLQWMSETPMRVLIAYSADDVQEKLLNEKYLTQRQKDGIAALLAREDRDQFHPAAIRRALEAK